jgi:hypothetical protein
MTTVDIVGVFLIGLVCGAAALGLFIAWFVGPVDE